MAVNLVCPVQLERKTTGTGSMRVGDTRGTVQKCLFFNCTTDLVPKGNARNLSGNLCFYEGVVAYYLVMLLVSVKAVANFVTTIFNY